jgi:hypothetical protein
MGDVMVVSQAFLNYTIVGMEKRNKPDAIPPLTVSQRASVVFEKRGRAGYSA